MVVLRKRSGGETDLPELGVRLQQHLVLLLISESFIFIVLLDRVVAIRVVSALELVILLERALVQNATSMIVESRSSRDQF